MIQRVTYQLPGVKKILIIQGGEGSQLKNMFSHNIVLQWSNIKFIHNGNGKIVAISPKTSNQDSILMHAALQSTMLNFTELRGMRML
jgi:hypothetical protein